MNKKLRLTMLLALLASSLIMIRCKNASLSKENTHIITDCSNVVAEKISSPNALVAIGADAISLAKSYKLTKDIDLKSQNWTPIGFNKNSNNIKPTPFKGSFYGCGFAIKNLKIDKQTDDKIGLFAQIGRRGYNNDIVIKDLTITLATAGIRGNSDVGGLAGLSYAKTITNVNVKGGAVVGTNAVVGGLVGGASGSISNSYATCDIYGTDVLGGLVGYTYSSIYNSYATGNVSGNSGLGGLVGYSYSTIYNSYATGNVSGANSMVGGLVGKAEDSIDKSYATGNVSGKHEVGGLIGYSFIRRTISNSYATGNVLGTSFIGGLVGAGPSTIGYSYATGAVSPTTGANIGGLVGDGFHIIISSYFDLTGTGQTKGVGGGGRLASVTGIEASSITLTSFTADIADTDDRWSNTIWLFTNAAWPTLKNMPTP